MKLFDSIMRGYPIGSLLFWKRPAADDPAYRLGGATMSLPAHPDAWWMVDGQQRVTALAAALLELDHGGDTRWAVHFDPAEPAFLSGAVPASQAGLLVPLSVLGDLRRLGRWLRDSRLSDDAQTLVEDVQQRILDYQLSAYLMEASDAAALRGVFARMNSTGVRMKSDEVFQALLGERDRGGLDLNQLQAFCDLNGFGQPPRGEILKAVLAMSGHDPTKRPEALGEQAASNMISHQHAEDTLSRVVGFLQETAQIPAYSFLPYPVVFVILARWFSVFPESEPIHLRRLARWLWRAVITGTHERAAVSKLRHQVKLIRPQCTEDQVLEELQAEVGACSRVDWSLDKFRASNARSRVELLTLLSLKPLHRDGSPVSWSALLSSSQRVAREIFSSKDWHDLDAHSITLVKTAANRVLLDELHTGLAGELRRWDAVADRRVLDSHLIDPDMFDALSRRDIPSFLHQRRSKIQVLVSELLTERAGLELPVLRPETAYSERSL